MTKPIARPVAEVRSRALDVLRRYESLRGDYAATQRPGTCGSCFELPVARALGVAAGQLDDLLAELDEAGDAAGFHAGMLGADALAELIRETEIERIADAVGEVIDVEDDDVILGQIEELLEPIGWTASVAAHDSCDQVPCADCG